MERSIDMTTRTSIGDLESVCPIHFQGAEHSIEVVFFNEGTLYAHLGYSCINCGARYWVHLDLHFETLSIFVFYVLRSTNALEISLHHNTQS